jgi:helix-turn-helix protein
MANRPHLTRAELQAPFSSELAESFPVILSPAKLASLLGLSVKTVYVWISLGRLDGCFRRRGKHCLIWRDRALDRIFNGSEWGNVQRIK